MEKDQILLTIFTLESLSLTCAECFMVAATVVLEVDDT